MRENKPSQAGFLVLAGLDEGRKRSVVARTALDATTWLRCFFAIAAVDARSRRVEAATTSPRPQPFDLLGGGNGHGNDMVSSLGQSHVQQSREATARLDLGAGPARVV